MSFVFVFKRRLQDVLIKTNIFALLKRPQQTSSRRLDQDQGIHLGHTSSRRLQDVFKTSSDVLPRRLQDVLQKRIYDIFMTSSRCFHDVFMTSSRRFHDVLKTSCENVFNRVVFSRGRWGRAPSLFFAIICFFAITLKNYKLCYLKLN